MAPILEKKRPQKKTADDADWDFGDDYTGSIADDELSERKLVQKRFLVLTEADIRQRQEQAVARLSDVLAIPRTRASDLLRRHKWRVSVAEDAWFAEEELGANNVDSGEKDAEAAELQYCRICLESCPRGDMMSASASCRHYFCRGCWKGYFSASIADGLSSLTLACPEPSCAVLVSQELIDELATEEEKSRYAGYLLQSYVQHSTTIKWCPSPGCDLAVEYDGDGDDGYEVLCSCSHGFCWNCTEEVHRPVDCETVAKWSGNDTVAQQNASWILTYAKPCPKCKRPIEKNKGCNHMTCSAPCRFQFCWYCLERWKDTHSCNRYEASNEKWENSKEVLDAKRYMHYFERWDANHRSREHALSDLRKMRDGAIRDLARQLSLPEVSMEFVTDAWLQIAECRRALKWSYAYGYFIPEHEKNKLELFSCLQGTAESTLERLHGCVEYELHLFLIAKRTLPPLEEFDAFRVKLVHLTAVVRNHFKNLTRAMEGGLEDAAAAPEQDRGSVDGGSANLNRRPRKKRRKSASRS